MKRNNRIECIEIIRQVLGLHSIHSIKVQPATCPYRGVVEMNKRGGRRKFTKRINKRKLNHG